MRRTCGQKYRDEDFETQQREWLHDLHAACVEDDNYTGRGGSVNVERRAGSSQVEDARADVQVRERHSASWHVIERASGLNTGSEDQNAPCPHSCG